MHDTYKGRPSNMVLGTEINRTTMGYSDSTAKLLLAKNQNTKDEEKPKQRTKPSSILFKNRYSTITEKFSDKYEEASTNNAYFCHYTGKFYCYNCIAVDKKPIPWKAVELFDLTSYKVCKKAEKEINALYSKPIIQFQYDSNIVQNNQVLYDFMILKRQIYLMYDLLCNPEYLEDALRNSTNLLIKPNLFSLKNFYDINNNSLTKQVEDVYKLFQQHVDGCDVIFFYYLNNKATNIDILRNAIKKEKDCLLCNQGPKLFLFDIKNTSLCDKCNTMYHRSCLQIKDCEKCQHDC